MDPREIKTHADICLHLGHVVLCYAIDADGKTISGCHASDEVHMEVCHEECLLLRTYRAGYAAAVADFQKSTQS